MSKGKLLITATIVIFALGVTVIAVGNDMVASGSYGKIPSMIVTFTGVLVLFISYLCGYTVYRNHKDKLKEFLKED